MAFLLTACHQYDQSSSGLRYKITKGDGKVKPKQGEYLKFNIEYKMEGKDTVLNNSFGHIPGYMPYDTTRFRKHDFTEILPQCAVGDKIEIQMSVDTLKKLGVIQEYNKLFGKGDMIIGKAELLGVLANEQEVNADYQKEIEIEKQREIKTLQEYVTKKGIKAEKSPNGVFVEITTPGDMTQKADTGKQVTVYYKGYLLNGKVFDSNTGVGATHTDPLNVVIGARSVIPGWEEGLKYFGKGTKGKILVPAMMAYGPQNSGPIPAYSNLVLR
ncbi:hypothetical protein F5148DRAFT_1289521 [Russula earlei]|uniref:Uncharacterized protein n=1 Tax=Russula earlei TaxID=71964 RepID=A0ACC0TZ60_9AGAM|nr:hypothetical protein F5148DRAFT_1289521 [Russula earlei]